MAIENINIEEVRNKMIKLDKQFYEFGTILFKINSKVNELVNQSCESSVFSPSYGTSLLNTWNQNASTFSEFRSNFEMWSNAVSLIASNNNNFSQEIIDNYKTTGENIKNAGSWVQPAKITEPPTKALGENQRSYTLNGQVYYIAKTRMRLEDYEAFVQKNGYYQDTGYLDGQCNVLADACAADLMRGTYANYGSKLEKSGSCVRINNNITSQNEDDVLQFIYSEINKGHPVAVQVTQKRSNEGLRHWVTVVGYNSSVKSAKDLTPENLLVYDCYDGKVQTLATRNRRLFNQGNRGFQAYGPTATFLSAEVEV